MTRIEPSSGYVRYVIGLLFLVNVFSFMDRSALAALAPLIKTELALSDSELGLLLGLAFAAFYALCAIPIARWADRGSRRDIIALALAIWSVMTAVSGAAQNFWHLFLARVGVGAGEAGGTPSSQSLICDYVPPDRRGGVFSILISGSMAGAMAGFALAGWLGATIGWRWTFVALGLPGVVLAATVRLTLREPVRGRFETADDSRPVTPRLSFGRAVITLMRGRTYRSLVLFLSLNGFVQFGLLQWWPSFYARIFDLGISAAGASVGLAFGVGSGTGVLLGGLLANWAARRDVRSPLFLGAFLLVVVASAVVAAMFVPSASTSLVLVTFAQLCWGVLSAPVTASVYNVTPPHLRATTGAILVCANSVLGMGLGPLCVGYLSDLFAPALGHEALRYALLVPLALMPVLVFLMWAAARSLREDMQSSDLSLTPCVIKYA